jgi:tRNA-Thr(GGU) m(6)t(6)A37 methyltransferase TsaA
MKTHRPTVITVLLAICCPGFSAEAESAGEPKPQEKTFVVRPIGHVEKTDDCTRMVLDKKYQPGLLGLEGFSHIHVFWWFDQNDTPDKRATLQVHPRGNPQNPLTGVFATRSPMRPNLIALTLCKVLSIRENIVEVEKIDAFSGTPVLDIKPFIPGHDTATDAKNPDWLK